MITRRLTQLLIGVQKRKIHHGNTLYCKQQNVLLIKQHQEHGIRTITLNNPKKRNALSLGMLNALHDGLTQDMDSDDLRVIVLRAEGHVFSAGHDLKELTSAEGREYHQSVFERCTDVMTLVQDMPIPVVAQVQGLATAAGCQLVASCDIAIATEDSKFATPGVSVGLFCSTPAVAVARAIPRKVAMDMLLTGHPISAHDALKHGLVSKVVPADKIEEEVGNLTRRICETSRSVTALGKKTFYQQIAMDRNSAYRLAGSIMVENLSLEDGQEGIRAFVEKRQPLWTHSTKKVH